MRSLWGAELEPTQQQSQYLDVISSDSEINVALPMQMGEYEINRVLGRGGMGVVFEGVHKRMQRRVAIKVLAGPHAEAKRAQEQFLGEIRAVARLLHPRIVTAFDAGQFGKMVYLVMEYVDGLSWVGLLNKQGPQSVDHALHLTLQAAEGLAHAHLNGVIHRDVKPGNLMVTVDGAIKLLDLGLAAFAQGILDDQDEEASPSRRTICGTPEFMAPEQFEDGDLTEAVDIYALGCTLFAMLTGTTPYSGNAVTQLRAHCTAPIPQLADHGVQDRRGLQELLARMMAKDVNDRVVSMEQVIREISEIETCKTVSFAGIQALSTPSGFASDDQIGSSQATVEMSQRATVGVDLGGNFLAAAFCTQAESPRPLNIGSYQFDLLPAVVAPASRRGVVFGIEAVERLRGSGHTDRAAAYLKSGQSLDWEDGVSYPPFTPIAMLLRHIRNLAETQHSGPEPLQSCNLSLTVPSCFTQVMRRRLSMATELSGFDAVRLIDRNIAAGLSQFDFGSYSDRPKVDPPQGYWLVLNISDLGMEVSLLAAGPRRIQMLSVAGDLDSGEARWNRRLRKRVEKRITQLEARQSAAQAIGRGQLRQKIARAIAELSRADETEVEFRLETRKVRVAIGAKTILGCCSDLIEKLGEMLAVVLSESGVDGEDVAACLSIGPWASVLPVQNLIRNFGVSAPPQTVTQADLATAAANLGQMTRLPAKHRPRLIPCNAHDLGVFFSGQRSHKPASRDAETHGIVHEQVQLLIPRLTSLPAFANEQFPVVPGSNCSVTLVESASTTDTRWTPVEQIDVQIDGQIDGHSDGHAECDSVFQIDDQGRVQSQFSGPVTSQTPTISLSEDQARAVTRLLELVDSQADQPQ